MKKTVISSLQFIIPLSIGIFLIWYIIHDLSSEDKANILLSFKSANYKWIILSLSLGVISHISRAIRWKILIAPLGYKPRLINTFFAVMVGYVATMALHRVGEVIRCSVLTKYEKIPLNKLVGTVISERAIDMICLILFFVITLITQYKLLKKFFLEDIYFPVLELVQKNISFSIIIIFVFVALIITGLVIFVSRRKDEKSLFNKVYNLLKGLWQGIITIKSIANVGAFIFHTLLIWIMYFMMIYICLYCLPETSSLGLLAALSVFVFGSVGIIAVQGGIGAYPAIVMKTLMEYGMPKAIGFTFGWIVWTAQAALLLVLGLISFIMLPIVNKSRVE